MKRVGAAMVMGSGFDLDGAGEGAVVSAHRCPAVVSQVTKKMGFC